MALVAGTVMVTVVLFTLKGVGHGGRWGAAGVQYKLFTLVWRINTTHKSLTFTNNTEPFLPAIISVQFELKRKGINVVYLLEGQ